MLEKQKNAKIKNEFSKIDEFESINQNALVEVSQNLEDDQNEIRRTNSKDNRDSCKNSDGVIVQSHRKSITHEKPKLMHRVASNPHVKLCPKSEENFKNMISSKIKAKEAEPKFVKISSKRTIEMDSKVKKFSSVERKKYTKTAFENQSRNCRKKLIDKNGDSGFNYYFENKNESRQDLRSSIINRRKEMSVQKNTDRANASLDKKNRTPKKFENEYKSSISPLGKELGQENAHQMDPKMRVLNLVKKHQNYKALKTNNVKQISNLLKSTNLKKDQNYCLKKEIPVNNEKRISGYNDEVEKRPNWFLNKNPKFKSTKQIAPIEKNKSEYCGWKGSVFGSIYYRKLFPNATKISGQS